MFKKNTRHLQIPLTSHVDGLPEVLRNRLRNSWAETFYQEFFCRPDEEPLGMLYADVPSRPNVPVNVLVAPEFLKAANGWTDEELYDQVCYNIQVRYALGYRQLGEGYFDLRTLYYFRERLSRHMQETGENLLEQAFAQVTDEQLQAFGLKTGKQRMDSTQLASNIRQMGRVQLPVTVLQRVWRMLSSSDQERYAEVFAPYLAGHAGQYVYRLKQEDLAEHLQRIGETMQRVLQELRETYRQEVTYQVLARVFVEHFRQEQERLRPKENGELAADSLQPPDDLEATYREKNGQGYRGYVANLSETCDPENPLQLITQVQVAPNNVDDSRLLAEAVPSLVERTGPETLYTDGAYGSPQGDVVLQEHGVTLVQTGIRGRKPDPQRLCLEHFEATQEDGNGLPHQLRCPAQHGLAVTWGSSGKRLQADVPAEVCAAWALRVRCPVQERKRPGAMRLSFRPEEWRRAQRLRRVREQTAGRNLRAAIEATLRSLKHPFPAGKLPVRGRFRVACLVIGSAAVTHVRRIHRYLQTQRGVGQATKWAESSGNRRKRGGEGSVFSFVSALVQAFGALRLRQRLAFGW